MWAEFVFVSILLTGILLIPGFLLMRAIGARGLWAVLLAPIASLSLIAIIGQVLALAHIPSSPVLVLGIATVPALVACIVSHRACLDLSLPRISPLAFALCLLLGVALGYNLFLSRLDAPDALFQAYDVTQHLYLIRAMADSGLFTSLDASPYLTSADQAIAPLSVGGFYPAAWHALCALVVQATGCSAPLVINASMFVLCFLAFPLGVLALVSTLFGDSTKTQVCGALVSLAFVAFPWNLITFGPIYANVAGFALMPSAMALFVRLFADMLTTAERARMFGALLLSAIGLALCHPNTIFSCIVFLAPYCVSRICDACNAKGWNTPKKLVLSTLFIAFCLAFWVICFKLPIFKDTVTHVWPPFTRAFQVLINVLTLCYSFGFNYETAAQILLGLLVVFGIVKALYTPGKRWLVVSYALICYILLISTTHADEFKQLLAGFWYTDPMRLAAISAIAAIPLAALGAQWAYESIAKLVAIYNNRLEAHTHRTVIACVTAGLFLLVNFMPEFNFPGLHHGYSEEESAAYKTLEYRDWPKSVHTTFGDYRRAVEDAYSSTQPLDPLEEQFVDRLKTEEPSLSSDLIINNPMDGSFLTYGTDNLRLYYRKFVGFGSSSESKESRIIRERLCNYATDPEVQAAVEAIDARYVLVLRGNSRDAGFINLRQDYNETLFTGITSITEDTPGFTLVDKLGSMKLYKIDR